MNTRSPEQTLLMFSGGRDSTLAAARLGSEGVPLVLCTVSSSHLFGFERVRDRLIELRQLLPPSTSWIRVQQPLELATDTSFYERTCLPCHHAYVVVSGVLARRFGAQSLAFGYAGYQADWPEQTAEAIAALRRVLQEAGVRLVLPVHDLPTREAAIYELERWELSSAALEQKCSRQVSNIALQADMLQRQVALWEGAMRASLERADEIEIQILEQGKLGDLA